MALTFQHYVTLDSRACHGDCALVQLNRFMLNGHSRAPGDYFQGFRGPAAGKRGSCGQAKQWGYCVLSVQNGNPGAPRDFPQAGDRIDWKRIVDNAVDRALAVGVDQLFVDGNHRTALMTMFEAISYQGLHVTNDVDVFRLYVEMKSLTVSVGNFVSLS
ncbi:hypothetical protein DL96DRAFT_1650770 [Flagelloscypha sp. PMI_526]|nr:hypothetical protein DL96DRAFT_1650770 [Flagelloscypha sp. PMI_526]